MLNSGQIVNQVLSAVGQADDVALLTSTASDINLLLQLTNIYSDKYLVNLEGPKTKLLVVTSKDTNEQAIVTIYHNPGYTCWCCQVN